MFRLTAIMNRLLWLSRVLVLMSGALITAQANADISEMSEAASALAGKSFKDKEAAIAFIASADLSESSDISNTQLLEGLLNKQVVYDKKAKSIWYLAEPPLAKGSELTNILSGDIVTVEKKRQYRAVTINNKIRSQIKTAMATAALSSADAETRQTAARRMIGELDASLLPAIVSIRDDESDTVTKKYLSTAVSVYAVTEGSEPKQAMEAIAFLSGVGLPEAFDALQAARTKVKSDDVETIAALDKAIAEYEQSQRVVNAAQTLYFGLSLGSVLVLAGIGLAITFGVMGVINMAHGELIMIGAYTTYVLQQLFPAQTGMALLLSIPCAFVVSGLVGMAIERSVIRHLYGRPLETLLATFGISLILQQAVRSIFSPLNRSVSTPDFMSGMIEVTPMLELTASRMYIMVFCLIVFFALLFILKRTPLGLQVRAVSQNRAMARAMGVRSEWVDMATFGLGSGIAGVAGVALSQLTNVGPNMGQAYIIDSFMVVVFGGVGNLWGTLAAGLSLGVFNKVLEPWAGAVLAKILVLVFIILFIQKRPKGLFPQRGRMAEDN
ncbi:High-affinity branched-chain amino acid transport system permease protein LivH [Grimontia celer]|uniref:High-affinity branched-chain amino acid transport system permease protein LivH n=2 Tax=Grimontia celer TaxID=1796497 RepID=A0A128F7H6_9GAMM|nr:High-affinity branched-chain amino acid transport system permease protein LivH [Grimontia celer]